MSLESKADEILADGLYDWISLQHMLNGAEWYAEESGVSKEDAIRELIAYLLGEGLMEVGELGNGSKRGTLELTRRLVMPCGFW